MTTPAPESAESLGMVLGSVDATPLQFWFAVRAGAKVQLDDVVTVTVQDPSAPDQEIRFYGVVDEVRRKLEGVQFEGDTELVADGLLPASVSYAAHVLVTRVDPEEFVPPGPGDAVSAARGEALERALYLDHMEARLPAGVMRNGEAGFINLAFLDGTKGAHVNISGISGVATKTSYALFLLYSLFQARQGGRPLLEHAHGAKALVFNVKGQDLFFLDRPNRSFREEERRWQARSRAERSRYEVCGLPEGVFESCELHAPAREVRGRGEALMADIDSREGVSPYLWSLHAFARERMLPFALSDRDSMSNLGFLTAHVEERLFRLAQGQAGPHLEVEAFRAELGERHASGIEPIASDDPGLDRHFFDEPPGVASGASVERLETFDDLVDFLEAKLLLQDSSEGSERGGDRAWTANQARATREAFIRRLRGAAKHLRRLVRGDLPGRVLARGAIDILGSDRQLHVVDIHQLAPLAQMFVVGVLLRQVFEGKEQGRRGKVFVVLDELNKYAPAEGDSPIKEVLLDIAERGRSLGVILIGAQQTASEVERRVVANAAIRVSGRLDAAEAERPEYRFMPASLRLRSTILSPGTMIVHQPDVPTPMMLTFPFPSWATRRSEVEETVSDEEAQGILDG